MMECVNPHTHLIQQTLSPLILTEIESISVHSRGLVFLLSIIHSLSELLSEL